MGDRKGGQDPARHAQDFDDILLFNELRSGVKELIETRGETGIKKSTEYKWFGGKAKRYPFDGDGSVIATDKSWTEPGQLLLEKG